MVNFGPLAPEIGSLVWGTQANFNGFRVFASLLQRRRSTEANQTLRSVGHLGIAASVSEEQFGLLPK